MIEYEITKRLSPKEASSLMAEITKTYGSRYYRHTSDSIYYVGEGTFININGKTYTAVQYYPVNTFTDDILRDIPHIRPLHEFLDGRFTSITTNE